MSDYSISAARTTKSAYASSAGSWVGMSLQPALDYIRTIGTNNPPEKVGKRRDIKAALAHASSGGLDKALPLVHEAWAKGLSAGALHASDQIKSLGLGDLPVPDIDDSLLIDLVGDIERIMGAAPGDVLESYVIGGDESMVKAQRRAAYRVSLAVEAAFTHAQQVAVVAALKDSGTLKQWVTRSALPCSHCVHLSLLPPIPWDEEFPEHVPGLPILSVYAKKFLGPPRHPGCLCGLAARKA